MPVRRLLLLSLLPWSVSAAVFLVPSDSEMIRIADAIVVGTVVDVLPVELDAATFVTRVTIQTQQVLKGSVPVPGLLVLSEPGGIVGDRGVIISGAPRYLPNETVLVFAELTSGGDWRTWGLELGKFTRTRPGPRAVFVRPNIVGWNHDRARHQELARDAAQFLEFIRVQTAGGPMAPDYFVPAASTDGDRPIQALSHFPPSAYLDPALIRRPGFDSGGSISYFVSGTQPGFDSIGGAQRALAAWTNDPNSRILIFYGGTTAAGFTLADGINTIVLNQPGSVPPPAIAYAQMQFFGTHVYKGETLNNLTQGDVVTGSVFVNQTQFEEALTHEIGHTIGFRHSDAGTPTSFDAVMRSVIVGTYGSNLASWDREAAGHVYTTLLDVDGNGLAQPFTDGVLILRRLFGFSGASLTSGAIGAGATRTTAAAIAAYIDSIRPQLDIDGIGGAQPFTDGVLILRYLFGFRGAVLTNGAVAPGAPRSTPAAVEGYLVTL